MSRLSKFLLAGAIAVALLVVFGIFLFSAGRGESPGIVAGGRISEADHAAFIESAVPACKRSSAANPDVANGTIPAAAIDGYCRCFAGKSADAVTPDEMQSILDSSALPPSFQAKSREIVKICSAEYLTQAK